ncbi:MAG TPA: hypothetical protein VNZ22_05690 [Bacillota bacterium]|nr:hypothetical protein [Bacillota bacterium]
MKLKIGFSLLTLAAATLFAADSSPKEEVTSAAAKLAQQSNYSWKTTTEFGNFNSTTEGKSQKDGLVALTMTFGDNTTTAFLKEGKGAIKASDQDWQSLAEIAANSEPGMRQFLARRLQSFKAPAAEASDLAGKAKELKKDGEAYGSDLTETGAKELLSFGGRRGANAPEPKNAKGSVKFWVKDGLLSKYELKLQGNLNFNGEDRDVDRTTTVEIKDVGTTKIEVPEAAQKKLSAASAAAAK